LSTEPSQKTLSEILSKWLKEAAELRYGAKPVPIGADQSVLLAALQDYRARLDRIEYLMVQAVLIKGKAYRATKVLQDDAQDKWDESLTRNNAKKTASLVGAQEFIAPKEKYASANLATFEERRAVRISEDDLSWAETSVDAITKMYRGLDSARQDLLTRIKAIPMVNSMEYTTS
jgi:hypothetical protein